MVTVTGATPTLPPQPVSAIAKGGETAGTGGADEGHLLVIRSPMVGTFYAAPSPDAAPFVKVGDSVGPESTVCIVEAMKVFNEIPAECSGKIVAVLATSGDPVEFGQPLYRVAPN
jgi:acetyl-CoA carboxylase biotin carboxyl carrier protein